jgi:peptidoglycan/LPS O-acetylase OafA/YrhL
MNKNHRISKPTVILNSFQDPQQLKTNIDQNFYNNSFNFLRLFLAFCVVISHSFALYFGNEFEPRLPLNGYYITLGNFAVYTFFVISGFVITHSWINRPKPKEFISNRIKRIFPGLLTCLFITIILFAPFLDSSPLHYSQTQIPNAIKYFALNATGFNLEDNIGNILGKQFSHNEINPVLWTIRYEIIAYLLIILFGFFHLLKKQTVIILFLVSNFLYWLTLEKPQLHDWLNQYFMLAELFMFLAYFFAGSAIYFYRERLVKSFYFLESNQDRHSQLDWESPSNRKLKTIVFLSTSIILLYTAIHNDLLSTFGPICIAILVINLGYILPFQNFRKLIPDISFGVYIYGWLIQLIIIKYFKIYLDYPQYISFVIIATILCGFISYYLVEKRFLKVAKNDKLV